MKQIIALLLVAIFVKRGKNLIIKNTFYVKYSFSLFQYVFNYIFYLTRTGIFTFASRYDESGYKSEVLKFFI